MKVYTNVYHVNKNEIIPSNDPFLMKWSKLQNLIPEEVIDSLPRSTAPGCESWYDVFDLIHRMFDSFPPTDLSFLFSLNDPWFFGPLIHAHRTSTCALILIQTWSLNTCGSQDHLTCDPIWSFLWSLNTLKIWSWNDSLLWFWIRRILIWFSSLKPIITGSEFLLLKTIPDFQCIPWICVYSIFWSLNPESWHIQLPECDPENYSRNMNAFHGSVFFYWIPESWILTNPTPPHYCLILWSSFLNASRRGQSGRLTQKVTRINVNTHKPINSITVIWFQTSYGQYLDLYAFIF